jgi:hypothetical protein
LLLYIKERLRKRREEKRGRGETNWSSIIWRDAFESEVWSDIDMELVIWWRVKGKYVRGKGSVEERTNCVLS